MTDNKLRPHVVRQGETLLSIAVRNGVANPDAIWSAPENTALRELRPDPSILCPGDILYIPEVKPKWLPVTVGMTNTFIAPTHTQPVKLVLRGDRPLANEPYVVKGLGQDIRGTTDASGALTVHVPVHCDSFVLELADGTMAHRVMVGHLDPISEPSGVRQRLSNLGYACALAPLLEPFGVSARYGIEGALRVFQLESGLAATGEVGADTLDALQKSHGT